MTELVVRAARPEDRPAVIALLAASLGRDEDDRYPALYAWKHEENAFGPSPAWVAESDGRIVAIRVLMRWEFVDRGRVRRAVRAVDTATHPEFQGRGLFTRLTRHGLDEVGADGVELVFNTPNDQSRPGYLKMGWQEVGRLPVAIRPRGPLALARIARARVPAERWSIPSDAGHAAADALADAARLADLLDAVAPPRGIATHRTPEFFRWRYGTPLLHYRVVAVDDDLAGGFVVFRMRRRGPAVEAAIGDVVVPAAAPGRARTLLRAVRRVTGADYLIALGARPAGFVPFPRQGPILTWRPIPEGGLVPALGELDLRLGDIELF